MKRLIIERSVPFVAELAPLLGEVTYLDNKDFTPENIQQADALLVRSITRCNEALLRGSGVSYIATATAGFEHIDANYCLQHHIRWSNAPGCNALAVAQYVFSALALLCLREGISLQGKTIGIVGVGNVGKQIRRIAPAFGLRVLCYDPPRVQEEGPMEGFVDLQELQLQADIISLHVPLTTSGDYPTFHLIDHEFLSGCMRQPILINACRGGVTDTQALIEARRAGLCSHLIIDCWEHEPHISAELLELTDIATPHIAGFSADGKFNGSRMSLGAIAKAWGVELPRLMDRSVLPSPNIPLINLDTYPPEEALYRAMLHTLDLTKVDEELRQRQAFEALRRSYPYPREMHAYSVYSTQPKLLALAQEIGFEIASTPH